MKHAIIFILSTVSFAASLFIGAQASAGDFKKFVIIGDSITEGYGVSHDQAYPELLEKKIIMLGKKWMVINSGISGSTSASAPSRMKWVLKDKPNLAMIALGANDGLRGLSTSEMEKNLGEALDLAKKAGVTVILAGMKLPPNYGKNYGAAFDAVFPRVAEKYKVPFIPFLLKDVGGIAKLNLEDGIHPNEKGHAIVAETVFEAIKKYL